MPMAADEIEALIVAGIPDARVEMTDLAGDGDHWAARVTAESFRGLPRLKQQRAVYAALGEAIRSGALHAVNISALTEAEAGAKEEVATGGSRFDAMAAWVVHST